MLPTVSIILPTFNGERYLKQQIDSILFQTFRDFELLIVDDGSSDGTVDIIDRYSSLDSRVRYIATHGNKGHKRRLLDLVNESKGEYVSISDQDDIWDQQKTEKLINHIGENALIVGRSQLMDEYGNNLRTTLLEKLNVNPLQITPLKLLFEPFVSAHAAIIRRQWIDPAAFLGSHPFDRVMGLEAVFSDGVTYEESAVVMHRIHDKNQMNSVIMKKNRSLISRHRFLEVISSVKRERIQFYQLLEQMSRSAVIDRDVRQIFKEATEACWYAWYHPSMLGVGPGKRLRNKLMELFNGFAVSAEDSRQFENKMRRLTMPQTAPSNLFTAFLRYNGRD